MTSDSIAPRVKSVMAQTFGVAAEDLAVDASPQTVAEWDSLRHMNLVLALEGEFQIEFAEDEIPEILSLPKIAETIAGRLAN